MNKFIIVVEGQDKTGKDTLVKSLLRKLYYKNPLIIHCIGHKQTGEEGFQLAKSYYENLFNLISSSDQSFILNRSHIGEFIYSPLYRDYSGEYVFDLEKEYLSDIKKVFLITLIDSSHNRLGREDEDALSIDVSDSLTELRSFLEAHEMSSINNKLVIDIANKDIDKVRSEAFEFILSEL